MSILHNIIPLDLVELSIVDFDVILRMHWLHTSYSSIDCQTQKVTFYFPNAYINEWRGSSSSCKSWSISYLKAYTIISKGCIYHLERVRDVTSQIPSLESVPIVNEYLDIFLEELPGVPSEREIDFDIELLPDTNPSPLLPIEWPPGVKGTKRAIKVFVGKGFIWASRSSWGVYYL